MASRTPTLLRRYMADAEGRYRFSWVEYRLRLGSGDVEAPLETANGVQVLWRHGATYAGLPAAIGRVQDMRLRAGRLEGDILLSEELLATVAGVTLDTLEEGINSGLSIGFSERSVPEVELREGSMSAPHIITFGKIQIREVSLTPMPRLSDCGILFSQGRPVEPEQPMTQGG